MWPAQGVGARWCRRVLEGHVGKIVSQVSPNGPVAMFGEGFPSRRHRPAGSRPPGPGGAPRRTYDLDQAGVVWLPSVCGGKPECGGRHPGAPRSRAGSPGRRRPSPGHRAGGPARRRQDHAKSGASGESGQEQISSAALAPQVIGRTPPHPRTLKLHSVMTDVAGDRTAMIASGGRRGRTGRHVADQPQRRSPPIPRLCLGTHSACASSDLPIRRAGRFTSARAHPGRAGRLQGCRPR
jgi:hypothetical protein